MKKEHKAKIGVDYIDEVKRRIKVREAAKEKVTMKPPTTKELIDALTRDLDEFIAGSIVVKNVQTYRNGYFSCDIHTRFNGLEYQMNEVQLPRKQCTNASELYPSPQAAQRKKELCGELEFLHRVMHPNIVSKFQTYVARLWAMDTYPPRPDVMKFIDDFLMSQRTFTCKL